MFFLAKGLQAIGIVDVAYALFAGIARDDMWTELKVTLVGLALFGVGRLLERRA